MVIDRRRPGAARRRNVGATRADQSRTRRGAVLELGLDGGGCARGSPLTVGIVEGAKLLREQLVQQVAALPFGHHQPGRVDQLGEHLPTAHDQRLLVVLEAAAAVSEEGQRRLFELRGVDGRRPTRRTDGSCHQHQQGHDPGQPFERMSHGDCAKARRATGGAQVRAALDAEKAVFPPRWRQRGRRLVVNGNDRSGLSRPPPKTRKAAPSGAALSSSGKRDSNSRLQPWQGCALPTELFPRGGRKPTPTLRGVKCGDGGAEAGRRRPCMQHLFTYATFTHRRTRSTCISCMTHINA